MAASHPHTLYSRRTMLLLAIQKNRTFSAKPNSPRVRQLMGHAKNMSDGAERPQIGQRQPDHDDHQRKIVLAVELNARYHKCVTANRATMFGDPAHDPVFRSPRFFLPAIKTGPSTSFEEDVCSFRIVRSPVQHPVLLERLDGHGVCGGPRTLPAERCSHLPLRCRPSAASRCRSDGRRSPSSLPV